MAKPTQKDLDLLRLENLNLRLAVIELQGEILNRNQAELIAKRDELKKTVENKKP